jgi:tryptophanyl-tRNA synthetase
VLKQRACPILEIILGAFRPAIDRFKKSDRCQHNVFLYFVPDYHSLISHKDVGYIRKSAYEVAATWLACGLDPSKSNFL